MRTHIPCCVWLLGGLLTAQLPYVTSPPGHLGTEGAGYTHWFGCYPNSRNMLIDGELTGSPMSIKGVDFRVDYADHSSATAAGRSWSAVSLTVSHSALAFAKVAFGANQTSGTTQVFSGSVTWPAQTGRPVTQPALFGGLAQNFRFPFSSSWTYNGNDDLALDFDFNGGTLSSGASWGDTQFLPYQLDSFFDGPYTTGLRDEFGAQGFGQGCIDPRQSNGARAILHVYTYNQSYGATSLQGRHQVTLNTWNTAPGAPVFAALGLSGSEAGLAFGGVTCNKLHVTPLLILPGIADSLIGRMEITTPAQPYTQAAVGLPVWAQAGFSDSATGALMLTTASRTMVPNRPATAKRAAIYQPDKVLKATDGIGVFAGSHVNPLIRYQR